MTVRELFSCAATDTDFKVSIHDRHYHYLESSEGNSILYVDFSDNNVFEADCVAFEKAAEWHIVEWWVTFTSGTIHVVVEEDIPDN